MRLARIAPAAAAAAAALACSPASTAASFVPNAAATFARPMPAAALGANVLDGKDIEGEFTPINNMVLVKKAGTIDTTEGGIILTGKVRGVPSSVECPDYSGGGVDGSFSAKMLGHES